MLLITTPMGTFGSVYYIHRLAGGLVILLVALFLLITAAFARQQPTGLQNVEHHVVPGRQNHYASKTHRVEMLIIIVLFAIVASLGHALFSMSTQQTSSEAMINALTVRICLSFALLALPLIGWRFGWIEPRQVLR